LFKEGDFVILTPDAVRGIIEIKANMQNQGVTDIIRQANENGQSIFSGKKDKRQKFFNGIFSYEGFESLDVDRLVAQYKAGNEPFIGSTDYKKFKVNHVTLNKNWFIKLWNDDQNPHSLYNIEELSFPFFISNLVDTLSNNSVKKNNFIWYATDKELNLRQQF